MLELAAKFGSAAVAWSERVALTSRSYRLVQRAAARPSIAVNWAVAGHNVVQWTAFNGAGAINYSLG